MIDYSSPRRVAVVGGGITGCATAFMLARAGAHVSLIERGAIAAHASGCNAGNLNPLHRTPPEVVPLALEAMALHRQIAGELEQLGCPRYSLLPAGRIHLGRSEADREELQAAASLFANTAGFSSAWLDRSRLEQIEPRLADDFGYGVMITGNLSVDSGALSRALAAGAVRLGAHVLFEAVADVEASGARVTGIRTQERVVPCDEVVFATGPWIAELRSWLGVDVPVEPIKGELLLMRLPGGAPTHDLHWGSAALYRRQQDQVWVGGTMESCGFDDTPSAAGKDILLTGAADIIPAIRRADLLGHIAALRPMTVSHRPIADRAQGWENAYIANGGGMKGVLLSLSIARTIRDRLLRPSAEPAAGNYCSDLGAHSAAPLH